MPAGETDKSYYTKGCAELATETPVTLKKLEARRVLTKNSNRLVIALVGLPARGKSFVARKLNHYLSWSGCRCRIFNVGRYRREAYASMQQQIGGTETVNGLSQRAQKGSCDANFFDSGNQVAAEIRQMAATMALEDMLRWLDEEDEDEDETSSIVTRQSSGSLNGAPKLNFKRYDRVAIFDATNSTNERRNWILEMCTSPERRGDKPTGVVFVESICDDQELLEENYRYKISNSPDFDGMSKEEALEDLRNRVQKYEEQYETIQDDYLSYIKVFNLSTKLLVNHIYGRMAKELVPALMAWHIGTRPVFLCRPGQTISGITTDGEDYVARNKIDSKDPRFMDMSSRSKRKSFRGDSLGPAGKQFREDLLDFCYDEAHSFMFKRASVRDMADTGTSLTGLAQPEGVVYRGSMEENRSEHREPFPLRIMTSTMPRAIDTANWEDYQFRINQMSNLNPLDKGDFAGMELEEIKKVNPAWYEKLERDPFGTRFPGGESYRDLIRRLTSVVIDVEQQVTPTLVVSHVSILQCLMAYFRNTPIERCMSIEVPLHTVIKFTPVRGGGWAESQHTLIETEAKSAMQPVESMSEFSALSVTEHSSSPIWGDHVTESVVRGT